MTQRTPINLTHRLADKLRVVAQASALYALAACAPPEQEAQLHAMGAAGKPAPAFDLQAASIDYDASIDSLVFQATVKGAAGSVVPRPAHRLDGAPVLGYVFLTTLAPTSVGFPDDVGTLALAVTSHPDFDDSPMWDEDANGSYDDDGRIYHTHWVVLVEDARAPAGLSVRQAAHDTKLPPTAPMPMYMDSPGFTVVEDSHVLRVLVPLDRVSRRVDFEAEVVTAYMQVDASQSHPRLDVHEILDELEQPVSVGGAALATKSAWPVSADPSGAWEIVDAQARYRPDLDLVVFSVSTAGLAGSVVPQPAGALAGAPVLGYVFPTTLSPSVVGFGNARGTLALAVTSHPDFDDSPLWDENLDRVYDNDGQTYHVHWVVLQEDGASAARLSVPMATADAALPKTAPMHMLMDSPGFHAFASGNRLHVLVPLERMGGQLDFRFDALAARMQIDASSEHPILRVQEVLSLLSGDLSLPFRISRGSE